MNDDKKIGALETFGRQLDSVIPQTRRRQRTRRVAVLAVAATTVVAAPALATSDLFDFGGDVPAAGEPGGPPPVVEAPKDPTLNVIAVVDQPDGVQRLRDRVEPYGLRVRVEGRPVAAAAVGQLFGVQFPRQARFDTKRHLVLEQGSRGTIIVTLGRPAPSGSDVGTAGFSLYEVLPQVQTAVRREDPQASLNRLRDLGFDVTVKLIVDNPDRGAVAATGVKDVSTPPDGTVVLSMLNANGQNTATADTRELIMEVAPATSSVARGHHP